MIFNNQISKYIVSNIEEDNLDKSALKQKAKESVKKIYKIGDYLLLKGTIKDGSKPIVKEFIIRKVIWTARKKIYNVLVLKQISGPQTTIWSLTKNDCLKYHIKYEDGLVVYPMEINFIKKKQNK